MLVICGFICGNKPKRLEFVVIGQQVASNREILINLVYINKYEEQAIKEVMEMPIKFLVTRLEINLGIFRFRLITKWVPKQKPQRPKLKPRK